MSNIMNREEMQKVVRFCLFSCSEHTTDPTCFDRIAILNRVVGKMMNAGNRDGAIRIFEKVNNETKFEFLLQMCAQLVRIKEVERVFDSAETMIDEEYRLRMDGLIVVHKFYEMWKHVIDESAVA